MIIRVFLFSSTRISKNKSRNRRFDEVNYQEFEFMENSWLNSMAIRVFPFFFPSFPKKCLFLRTDSNFRIPNEDVKQGLLSIFQS